MNVLFIGGPMDGKRLSITDGMRTFYAYETTEVPATPSADAPKKIEYRAETLRDKDGRDYVVMACCGENIVERLLGGYAPNEKSEGPRGFSRGPSSTDLLEG